MRYDVPNQFPNLNLKTYFKKTEIHWKGSGKIGLKCQVSSFQVGIPGQHKCSEARFMRCVGGTGSLNCPTPPPGLDHHQQQHHHQVVFYSLNKQIYGHQLTKFIIWISNFQPPRSKSWWRHFRPFEVFWQSDRFPLLAPTSMRAGRSFIAIDWILYLYGICQIFVKNFYTICMVFLGYLYSICG